MQASLFHDGVLHYLRELTAKTKPRAIIVCMIYVRSCVFRLYFLPSHLTHNPWQYPDMTATPDRPGWADFVLNKLGYFQNPGRIQRILRGVYARATVPMAAAAATELGCPVLPLPLFRVLDGSDPRDYAEKVEPSSQGGNKMARAFIDALAAAGIV